MTKDSYLEGRPSRIISMLFLRREFLSSSLSKIKWEKVTGAFAGADRRGVALIQDTCTGWALLEFMVFVWRNVSARMRLLIPY